MRVLIVGAGAVGGYYGGRLMEIGRDVTFLVRERRQAALARTGLVIQSPAAGDFQAPAKTLLAAQIVEPFDLVVLSCKAYDLGGAMDSAAAAVGPQTMVLPLLNGMRHLDILEGRFGSEKILGGLCAIGATLDADGRVIHLNGLHILTFGERAGGESPRIRAVAELMAPANFEKRASDIILQEMWEKWVFLASLAGSTCLMRAAIGDIVAAGGKDFAEGLLAECQSVGASAGHGSRPEVLARALAQLTAEGVPTTASMLRDMEKGGRVEADHVLGDLLARGQAAGLALPLLRLAYLHVKAYEARRERAAAHP